MERDDCGPHQPDRFGVAVPLTEDVWVRVPDNVAFVISDLHLGMKFDSAPVNQCDSVTAVVRRCLDLAQESVHVISVASTARSSAGATTNIRLCREDGRFRWA